MDHQKVSILGGAGFVGTNLCQSLLDRQMEFEILDLKKSQRFPEKTKICDVRDIETLRRSVTGDVIVNQAAVHRDDVAEKNEYYQTNVQGAENIAQLCSEKGIKKIVFTSTVAVYGFAEPGTDESGKINPFNEYGATKFQAEERLRDWQSGSDNCLVIVRPTVIFGEGNRGNVFNLLKQIASGRFVMIGAGKNRKSMAYVSNVVAFLERCIETEKEYVAYNYVDTPDLQMNDLVRQVRQRLLGKNNVGFRIPYWIGLMLGLGADAISFSTGRKLPISAIRIRKFCASTAFNSAKADLDGFRAPFSLQEGIDRTLESEFIRPARDREIYYTE